MQWMRGPESMSDNGDADEDDDTADDDADLDDVVVEVAFVTTKPRS